MPKILQIVIFMHTCKPKTALAERNVYNFHYLIYALIYKGTENNVPHGLVRGYELYL